MTVELFVIVELLNFNERHPSPLSCGRERLTLNTEEMTPLPRRLPPLRNHPAAVVE
jgi:hypothetical protein